MRIFLQIVSKAYYEEYNAGVHLNIITTFWRIAKANSNLAKKLTFDIDSIAKNWTEENIVVS